MGDRQERTPLLDALTRHRRISGFRDTVLSGGSARDGQRRLEQGFLLMTSRRQRGLMICTIPRV